MGSFKTLILGATSAGKVQIEEDGVVIGTRKAINFIEGINVK